MEVKGLPPCSLLILVLGTACLALSVTGVESGQATPALFLTVKSCNFCMTKVDHIKCGYLIVTDILISPDGVPLPFFNDNSGFLCVFKLVIGELLRLSFVSLFRFISKGISKRKSGLKIISSFGGSVVPSELFAFLSCDDKRRAAFVNNLVEFTLAHGFHGIDLAWLYPAPQEREQYVRLLRDLRLACDLNGLVLTVTVPSRPSVIEVNYPVAKLEKYADYVILSTTEFRKLRKTSFIAPLYSCSPGSSNSVDYHVDRWKMAGLSCGKIVIVVQTMTLTYKLYIQNEYRVGTPALQLKIRPYYKICRKLYSGSLEIWDSNVKSPYAFRDLSWYSYENEKSVKEKVCFVVQQGLGGLAVFYYDEDDPINICGDGQYPLTAIVISALQSQYLPPAVITDSQIYHFDAPPLAPLSQMDLRHYANGAGSVNKPLVVYVDGDKPNGKPHLPEPSKPFSDAYFPPDLIQQLAASVGSSVNETSPNPFSSVEQMFHYAESGSDEHFDEYFLSDMQDALMEIGGSVDMLPPTTRTAQELPTMFSEPEPVPSTVQLFSEKLPTGVSSTCQLYSEQSSNHPVAYAPGSSCSGCSVPRPCTHCSSLTTGTMPAVPPAPCPCKLPGIRIFATAHGPMTTTMTTTTTAAPPSAMHFYTMAPATFQPPTFCQACKPCVKLVATGSAEVPKVTALPLPCPTTTPAPCPQAQLYSEHIFVPPAAGIQIQAKSVGAQPIVSFVPFKVNICPHDGILQDPLDRRSYYLCKRGLPMCDENKFNCAHGYIFNETSKKCVPEGSCKRLYLRFVPLLYLARAEHNEYERRYDVSGGTNHEDVLPFAHGALLNSEVRHQDR
uniref:GH18 domain-containing protein n=1 Tax=Anopheles dirus TaxID=7168 RepID=A0A182NPZ9_9DIPT